MTLDENRMTAPWQDRAPAMLRDPAGPDGEPCPTPMDRRWLWHLENSLTVRATTELQREILRDLRSYLDETCEHVWRPYDGDDVIPAHRQCLWCNDVQWAAS